MDSGMNAHSIYTLDERIALGTLPMDTELNISQIVGLMDQILACKVAHHKRILTYFISLNIYYRFDNAAVNLVWRLFYGSNIIYLSLST